MSEKIKFDKSGESQSFRVGVVNIYFRKCADGITVMHVEDGAPYPDTMYKTFGSVDDAQEYLIRLLSEV
jgi:hypothetical protein